MTPGTLAFIKTTGELVMVATHPFEAHRNGLLPTDLSGAGVKIYRALATQDGIRHEVETFPIELLETAEQKFDREYNEMFDLQAKARVKKAESQLSSDAAPAVKVPTLN